MTGVLLGCIMSYINLCFSEKKPPPPQQQNPPTQKKPTTLEFLGKSDPKNVSRKVFFFYHNTYYGNERQT